MAYNETFGFGALSSEDTGLTQVTELLRETFPHEIVKPSDITLGRETDPRQDGRQTLASIVAAGLVANMVEPGAGSV